MEANKNKKLTYDQLTKAFGDLHQNYQKLAAEYQKAMEALRNRDFDVTAFFLTQLFKVMDHPDMYKQEFVQWCADSIQAALTTFSESMKEEPAKEEKSETE